MFVVRRLRTSITKNKETKFYFTGLRCEKIKNIQKAEDGRTPLTSTRVVGFAATKKEEHSLAAVLGRASYGAR